jgi:hypothetical protein
MDGGTKGFAARLAGMPQAVNGDAVLLRRARNLDCTWHIDRGGVAYLVRIAAGRIAEATAAATVTPSADFAMLAEPAVWDRLLAASPPPGDHDFLAFVKRGELRLVGNLHPLMSHLLYFKGLLAALRTPEPVR